MKYGFIYIWYDKKRKMYYIGSHWGYADDGYICSSIRMKNAYKKRPNDFKRRILENNIINRNQILEQEEKWLKKAERKKEKYYNVRFEIKNKINWYISHSRNSVINRMKESIKTTRNNMSVKERKQKYGHQKGKPAWNKGIPMYDITKNKLRQINLGKKHSEETKQKCRMYKHTKETKLKMSISRLGKPSPTRGKNWSLAQKENHSLRMQKWWKERINAA